LFDGFFGLLLFAGGFDGSGFGVPGTAAPPGFFGFFFFLLNFSSPYFFFLILSPQCSSF